MRNQTTFFTLILLFLLPLSHLNAKSQTVVLQVNESLPIWSQKLPFGGMGSEIIQAISKEVNMDTRIDFIPLKRLIADTTNNDIGNPLFYMDKQEFAAIIPIAVSYNSFFAYKNDINSLLLNSKGKPIRVGVLKGTAQNMSSKLAYLEESSSHQSLFKKLKVGRIDLVLELDLVGKNIINNDKGFTSSIIDNSSSPIAILLDINYPNAEAIALEYKKGLDIIIKNGTYQKILDKYYTNKSLPPNWYRDLSKFNMIYSIDYKGSN